MIYAKRMKMTEVVTQSNLEGRREVVTRSKDVVCGCQYFDGAINIVGPGPSTCTHHRPASAGNSQTIPHQREHEYEPVIPMDTRKTPPPFVKITADKGSASPVESADSNETAQDKRHLCVPDKAEYEDSDENDDSDSDDRSVEITAEELQHRIEERYFLGTPSSSQNDYELTETRSASPNLANDGGRMRRKSDAGVTLHDRMHLQADKIKQKFRSFKEQVSKDRPADTPRVKRKNDAAGAPTPKPAKKNKFNFRRHVAKSDRSSGFRLPSASDFHMPQAPRLSLPRLPSFSRSRSSSVKERERKRSQSSDGDSKKRFDFHFGTYPRFFGTHKTPAHEPSPRKCKPKSEPSSPTQRRSPFPQRWISRFTDHHKKEATPKPEKKQKKPESEGGTVVKETIFISLHEDPKASSEPPPAAVHIEQEAAATKMEIDNEKFIFISLHEERFPEKLQQKEVEQQAQQLRQQEQQIDGEIKAADTARKFHSMLRKLQTDRTKWKGSRTGTADDKPQPVEITEITSDDGGGGQEVVANNVEVPDEDESSRMAAENVSPENYSFESEETPTRDAPERVTTRTGHPEDLAQPTPVDSAQPARPAPRKWPRKKLRKLGSDQESKESLAAFEDSEFIDAVHLDEQQHQQQPPPPQPPMSKTYIKASLEQIAVSVEPVEPEQTRRQFKEYEEALRNSRSFSSIEIENNFYSRQNSLAGLEAPVPPARPSRLYSLARKKNREPVTTTENKENYYDLDANSSYNTFPIVKPDKPRRKFRKRRTYSNSTTNTEISKSIDELEDAAINKNIVNAKQLSVSFLPLTSNVVGEPITDYNIRETSSMIHLNLSDPPLPPKRKKERPRGDNSKYNSLLSRRYSSKTSLTPSDVYNNSALLVDAELEYADDVNSTVPDSDTPPKRPCRRRNPSLLDEDRTSRELESLPSERSAKDDLPFYDSDSKDGNGYAVIGVAESRRESKAESECSQSVPRRVSRRISDFFTLPRIRVPTNYVPSAAQTLDRPRFPSPSRPPRHGRPRREPVYTNEETPAEAAPVAIRFDEEERLDFSLAIDDEPDDSKHLRADDILEKMKSRPLPPPPRPLRKPRDGYASDYSRCTKNKPSTGACENNLNCNVEEKIINTTEIRGTLRSNWSSRDPNAHEVERITREESHQTVAENGVPTHSSRSSSEQREKSVHYDDEEKMKTDRRRSPTKETGAKNESTNECSSSSTRSESVNEISRRAFFNTNVFTQTSQSVDLRSSESPVMREPVNVITACKLNVSELNVGRLNINEIESAKLVTSTVESSTMQVSDVRTETDHLVFNSIDCSDCLSSPEPCQILEVTELPESTSCLEESESTDVHSMRSRFSSMIPEVGSDEESGSTVTKAVRPSRRKQPLKRDNEVAQMPPTTSESGRASLAELMCQIFQICHSSVGQAIHSLLEQVIPEDREKRSEVQAAIWVITIIVAGCLMLGLQSNEKIVHHHHWDFHFPPPH